MSGSGGDRANDTRGADSCVDDVGNASVEAFDADGMVTKFSILVPYSTVGMTREMIPISSED